MQRWVVDGGGGRAKRSEAHYSFALHAIVGARRNGSGNCGPELSWGRPHCHCSGIPCAYVPPIVLSVSRAFLASLGLVPLTCLGRYSMAKRVGLGAHSMALWAGRHVSLSASRRRGSAKMPAQQCLWSRAPRARSMRRNVRHSSRLCRTRGSCSWIACGMGPRWSAMPYPWSGASCRRTALGPWRWTRAGSPPS